MKVKFAIQKGQETVKTGLLSKETLDHYTMTATFTPSEFERKIYNDHPLFKKMIFLQYDETKVSSQGLLFKDKVVTDMIKTIYTESIYSSGTYAYKAYHISDMVNMRALIIDAVKTFVSNINILSSLVESTEMEYTIDDIKGK